MATSKAMLAVVILGLVAFTNAAGGRSLQENKPADLLSEAQNILGRAAGSVEAGLHSLVDGLFGPANSFFTQIPLDIQNLSWDSLQNLGFSNPVNDFVSSIQNKTLVHDILEAEEKVTDFIDQFCDGPTFEDSEKVPSNCVGKQMVVKLAPWACSLYENKTIACNPPYIEIIKQPAVCTAKYESAAVFTGKVCKLQKKIGQELTKTIGADAFSIDISKNLLDIPQEIASSLLPGSFDSADSTFNSAAPHEITSAGRR